LGSEGLAFVKERLGHGDHLANAVAKIALDQGTVFTFLPENVDPAALSLQDGGLSHFEYDDRLMPPIIDLVRKHLNQISNVAVAETRIVQTQHIQRFFSMKKFPMFLVESSLVRSYHSDTKQEILPLIGLYGYLSGGQTATDLIRSLIEDSSPLPIWLVVLTSWPPGETIVPGQKVEVDFLGRLAERASHIILGAYDDEAFVVWSRDPR
jgi:hypothetical protein